MESPVQVQCPKCGAEHDDFDGFGVLACQYCGYCSHPSSTDGVCGICGDFEGLLTPENRIRAVLLALVWRGLRMDRRECPYCHLLLPTGAEHDPDEHMRDCVWARARRVLDGKPIDGGCT